jgi:preprotein translocase subunit SecA
MIFRMTVTRQQQPNPVAVGGAAGSVGAATVSSGSSTATATRPVRPSSPGVASATGAAGALGSPIAGGLPPDPMARALRASGGGALPTGGAKPGFTPTGERIGRNDACWCGSGLKYKKCHGR